MRKLLGLLGITLFLPTTGSAAYTWGNVAMEGGGFVSAVIPSRTQPGLIYARTDVGGAYRWDSTAGRWIPLMDWVSQRDVGVYGTEALALDPRDSKRLYILGGTEYFSGGKTYIFRSGDYGNTFDTINVTSLFKAHGNGMGRQTGEKLAVDPQNGAILFCGSRTKGLFRSADSGKTWSAVAGTAVTAGSSLVNDNGISFVVFDPSSGKAPNGGTRTIYMGVAKTAGNLYVSQDGGATFTAIAGGPAQMAMRAVLSEGSLLVTFSSGPGPHSVSGGSVWKYATATGAWTNITPKEGATYYGSGGQSYAHGFGGITVDPADPKHLVVSTINYYGGQWRYSSGPDAWGDKIFVSRDGGATWTSIVNYAANDGKTPNADQNGNSWIGGHAVHWAGSLEFDPFDPRKVWVTAGNGVFRTDDIAATTPIWKFQSRGIEETVPLDIVSIPGGPLVTAIGDYDGSAYADISKNTPLHEPRIGTTQSLGYGTLNGSFLRAGQVTDYSTGTGITSNVMYHSADNAATWTKVPVVKGTHGMVALNADGSAFFHKPENSTTFWRSTDKGATWAQVTGLGSQSQYAPIVSDPVNPDRLYLLDNMGDFYASADAGATFAKVGSVVDNSKNLYSSSTMKIRAVPGKEGHLWIPLDQNQSWAPTGYSQNGLALTEDGGKTFTRFPAVQTCVAIGLGKAAPGASYPALYLWGAANQGPIGIYRSIDQGATWERINDDRHQYGGPGNGNFVVGDFNVFGRVYMSTVGRGLVYGQPEGASSISAPSAVRSSATIRRGADALLVRAGGRTDLRLEILDVQGRRLRHVDLLAGETRVSLAGLPKGVFFARVMAGARLEMAEKVLRD